MSIMHSKKGFLTEAITSRIDTTPEGLYWHFVRSRTKDEILSTASVLDSSRIVLQLYSMYLLLAVR